MKRYTPSETDRKLYPPASLMKCVCGVSFAPRASSPEDNPERCLACNRQNWSVLFRHVDPRPAAEVVKISRGRGRGRA